jgi:hypothetical protein
MLHIKLGNGAAGVETGCTALKAPALATPK